MSRETRDLLEERVKGFIKTSRERGLKLTQPRLEIFRYLASTKQHPSPDAVYQDLKPRFPNLSLDTIYRTLSTFEEKGLIRRLEVLDDRARYDADMSPHHHFVCGECQRVLDFEWPEFDQISLPDSVGALGRPLLPTVKVRGLCKDCLQKDKNE